MKKRVGSITYIHIPKSDNLITLSKYKQSNIRAFFFKDYECADGNIIEIASAIRPCDIDKIKGRKDIFIQELDYPIYQHKITSFIEEVREVLNYNNIDLPVVLVSS